MRVDREMREFFETLMQEKPPPEQEHLSLLIQDQLKTLRNKSGRCKWHTVSGSAICHVGFRVRDKLSAHDTCHNSRPALPYAQYPVHDQSAARDTGNEKQYDVTRPQWSRDP